jgi:multiple sugar transport system ATP-binding protein
MPAKLELRSVGKVFGKAQTLKDISLIVQPGEFVVLVGPSGCGKSTLLRLVAGLEEVTSGEILIDDHNVNTVGPAERRIGMVFQSYALYPHMTVADNIGFGLRLAGMRRAERERKTAEAMEMLQLTDLAERRPAELSGGQRQRVAIGRAIVRNPRLFLFDEPLSNLDAALRSQVRLEIGRLHRRLQNTVIYVTHDQVEAMTLADKIVVLESGEVRQIGAPMEVYHQPANLFVAGFIGSPKMNFMKAMVVGASSNSVELRLAEGFAGGCVLTIPARNITVGEEVTVGVRPEHCCLVDDESEAFLGTVLEVERLGADGYLFVGVEGAECPLSVRVSGAADRLAAGAIVNIRIDPLKVHVFDKFGDVLPSHTAPLSSFEHIQNS